MESALWVLKPLKLIPETLRSQFEQDVFNLYEDAVKTQMGWGFPEYIPLEGVINDQSVRIFQKTMSLLQFGDKEEYMKLRDIDTWTIDLADKYSDDHHTDVWKTIIRYNMSFHLEDKGFINLPCEQVW
jgi:hypothetical protein